MGFTEECFTRTDEQMMAEAFDWSAPAMDGITLESLRQSGWARLSLPVGSPRTLPIPGRVFQRASNRKTCCDCQR